MKLNEYIEITNEDNMELMARYPDKYFDLAIVDPPYGIERFKNGIGKNNRHKVKASSLFNNNPPKEDYFNELFRISNNQIVFGANNFTMPPSEYFLIWDKMQTVDNFASAEYAWVSMGLKTPAKVFNYSIHKHNHTDKIHPTQKPIALYAWILKNYAKQGDKIIDTHFGSGSIACAVHNANIIDKMDLSLVACELDKDYFESSIQRVKAALQTQSLF